MSAAEIHEKAQMLTGGTNLVQALPAMRDVDLPNRFQFDHDRLLNQQSDETLTDRYAIIHRDHATLLFDGEAASPQFVSKRVLVDLFQEPCTQRA